MALIIKKRQGDQIVQLCAKCGSPLPGPNACCDKALEASYRGMKAATTRHELGYDESQYSYNRQLDDGFELLNMAYCEED